MEQNHKPTLNIVLVEPRIHQNTGIDILSKLCGAFDHDQRSHLVSCHVACRRADRINAGAVRGKLSRRIRGNSLQPHHGGTAHLFQSGTQLRLEEDQNGKPADLAEIAEDIMQSVHMENIAEKREQQNTHKPHQKLAGTTVPDKTVHQKQKDRQNENINSVLPAHGLYDRHHFIRKKGFQRLQKSPYRIHRFSPPFPLSIISRTRGNTSLIIAYSPV